MKQTVEITQILKEQLGKCPNCEGPLEQMGSYTIRCKSCGNHYEVETRRERLLWGFFMVVTLSFVAGCLIALTFF